jgi:predicted Ser/Thr protein kinase
MADLDKPNATSVPDQIGRYKILSRLGGGGMGAVYLAEDPQLARRVALKVPHFDPSDGDEARKRFLEEARAAATLDHPYLCPVYDVGEADGQLYLTMAYIEGRSLADAVRAEGMPARQVAALVGKLALAMQEAHAKGIIHRDLKPANIMIKAVGGRREPVIVDFGLARREASDDVRLTRTGQVMGTLGYMAPEQVRGDSAEIGPACDIYAMGVILYELLTGYLPFRGSGLAVAGQILTQEPLPLSAHRPDVDPRLELICRKAMAKKIADRYTSMGELAQALTEYLKTPVPAGASDSSESPVVPAGDATPSRAAGNSTLVDQLLRDPASAITPAAESEVDPEATTGRPRWLWPVVAAAGAALALVLAIAVAGAIFRAPGGYTPLFNGKDIAGWVAFSDRGVMGVQDVAKVWRVDDGILHGEGAYCHLYSPLGDYENFRVRLEAKINEGGNSGLYLRATTHPDLPKGYEIQINSTVAGAKTGSLWVNNETTPIKSELSPPPANTWFTIEAEAIGPHIKVSVDGKPCVDYTDSRKTHQKGFFAIQLYTSLTHIQIRKFEVMRLDGDGNLISPTGSSAANSDATANSQFPAGSQWSQIPDANSIGKMKSSTSPNILEVTERDGDRFTAILRAHFTRTIHGTIRNGTIRCFATDTTPSKGDKGLKIAGTVRGDILTLTSARLLVDGKVSPEFTIRYRRVK